jgi:hypothetical protein
MGYFNLLALAALLQKPLSLPHKNLKNTKKKIRQLSKRICFPYEFKKPLPELKAKKLEVLM